MRRISGANLLTLGLFLMAAALLLGDAGLPHAVKLGMLIAAIVLELLGARRQCREKKQ